MAGSSEPAFSFRHKKGAHCSIGDYSSILQQPLIYFIAFILLLYYNIFRQFFMRRYRYEEKTNITFTGSRTCSLYPLASLAADAEPQAATEISEQGVVTEVDGENVTEESVPVTFNDAYGTWQRSGNRYWFRFNDGSYAHDEVGEIDGVTYAFDKDGWMVTGWGYVDGDWYYCNGSGAMQFGWQSIGGHWYYLDPKYGFMYADGFKEINGQTYRFNANGTLFYGWYQESGSWYYFDGNGYLSTGWKSIDGNWYFFDTGSHEMLSDGWYTINSVDYYFLPSGAMADGWVQQAGEWYYCPGGKDYTGWLASGGNWYYIADNWMVNDRWYTINGVDYYFLPSGAMADGWVQQAGEWYYCPGGKDYTGWLASGGNWYYIADSWMVNDGVYKINDKYCRFDASGVWQGYVDVPPQ